jgi:toxin ParE1/3/4
MPAFRLTRKAREDLKAIGRYTRRVWGIRQTSVYLLAMDRRFARLAENPELGQACDDIRTGYRRLFEGRHVIYYRQRPDHIEIVRVLHASMDPDRHL